MNSTTTLCVRRSISVDVPQARAFDTFVNMTAWWPLATHTIGEAPGRASIVEPRKGGRWYGIDRDGNEHGIGEVLEYERPGRLVLTWHVNHCFDYDPSVQTHIEIRFVAQSPTRTRVDFEHRGFEAYGERSGEVHERYEGADAWTHVLACYVAALSPSNEPIRGNLS